MVAHITRAFKFSGIVSVKSVTTNHYCRIHVSRPTKILILKLCSRVRLTWTSKRSLLIIFPLPFFCQQISSAIAFSQQSKYLHTWLGNEQNFAPQSNQKSKTKSKKAPWLNRELRRKSKPPPCCDFVLFCCTFYIAMPKRSRNRENNLKFLRNRTTSDPGPRTPRRRTKPNKINTLSYCGRRTGGASNENKTARTGLPTNRSASGEKITISWGTDCREVSVTNQHSQRHHSSDSYFFISFRYIARKLWWQKRI